MVGRGRRSCTYIYVVRVTEKNRYLMQFEVVGEKRLSKSVSKSRINMFIKVISNECQSRIDMWNTIISK